MIIKKKINPPKNKNVYKIHGNYILNVKINENKSEDNDFLEDDYFIELQEKKPKKVIIKTFSNQVNLKYYESVLLEKKKEIEKGIELLKKYNNSIEIIFLTHKRNNNLIKQIISEKTVVKINEIQLLNKEKLFKKLFKRGNLTGDVIIEDLLFLVYLGQSLEKKQKTVILTLFGDVVDGGKIIEIPRGTTIRELIRAFNYYEEEIISIVEGGVLTGQAIYDLDKIIEPYVGGLIFNNKIIRKKETTCIRCGKCLERCPKELSPIRLKEAWDKRELKEFYALEGENCIDCGLCSYICPCNIQLSHNIKVAKNFINKE